MLKKIIGLSVALSLAIFATDSEARGGGGGGRSHSSTRVQGTGSNPNSHYVREHTTKTGTVVHSHHSTNPNKSLTDNYGARGNINPHKTDSTQISNSTNATNYQPRSGSGSGGVSSHSSGIIQGTGSNPNSHYVREHTTKNGTVVHGHHATNPNKSLTDNYDARGNINPNKTYSPQIDTSRYIPSRMIRR
jgi:hypothetical protein